MLASQCGLAQQAGVMFTQQVLYEVDGDVVQHGWFSCLAEGFAIARLVVYLVLIKHTFVD